MEWSKSKFQANIVKLLKAVKKLDFSSNVPVLPV